jgi:hypothetical protein
MSEWEIMGLTLCKMLLIVICSGLYMVGGRIHKIIRRLGVSLVLIGGTLGFAYIQGVYTWIMCFAFFHCFIALSMGYGNNTPSVWDKIKRRAIYAVILGCLGLWFVLVSGKWVVFGTQLSICMLINIVFGVLNPVQAVEEEGLICMGSLFLIPFMI